MKNILPIAVLALVIAVVAGTLGYRAGSMRRYTWIKSDFIGTFAALQSLRSGDTTGAVERLEAKCFSLANVIYGTSALRDDAMPPVFIKDLREYRSRYRTNAAQWYPTEQLLETNLANWK